MSQRSRARANRARQSGQPDAPFEGRTGSDPASPAVTATRREVPPRRDVPRRDATIRRDRPRRDAIAIERSSLSQRRGLWLAVISVAIAIVLVTLAAAAAMSKAAGPAPITNVAGAIAWPAAPPSSTLANRVADAGLQLLNTEGEVIHIHQQLNVFVDGQQVAVPADIGIDQASGTLSPLHTHDATGVMHVESPTSRTFTLGDFFKVWGVPLSSQCIDVYCVGGDAQLRMWVNGTPYTDDPAGLVLASHQVIVIAYGTPAQIPTNIRSTYDWGNL